MICGMTAARLKGVIKRMFGKGTEYDISGKFCHVYLTETDEEARKEIKKKFDPEQFFDPQCPHCTPFLNEGALMVYTEQDLVGVRLLADGMVETVMLRNNMVTGEAN